MPAAGRIRYFAYGSNMSKARLRQRVPSALCLGSARLAGYRLAFHKAGRDGSAKCDIVPQADTTVHGVVFEIDAGEKPLLDRREDLGRGYQTRTVELDTDDHGRLSAFTYIALLIDPRLQPFDWYKQHVLFGATENRLPVDYVAAIAAVACIDDMNRQRRGAEWAIHNSDDAQA